MLTKKLFWFIITSYFIEGDNVLEIAINFLKALSKIRTPFGDTLVQLITRLGEEVIVLGVICLLYWCINKDSAYKLGMIFFASGMLVQGLKVSFRIERPWVIDPTFSPVESAKSGATGYSFPSGHTQSATSLYGYFALNSRKKAYTVIFIAVVLLVGFSRMYLGVHTFYDVLVSLAVSTAVLLLINRFYDKFANGERDLIVAAVLGGVSVLLCIYSYVLAKAGAVDIKQINDCFKSGGAGLGFAIGFYLERKYIKFDTYAPKVWMQVIKFVIGVAGALLFKSILKLISPGNLTVDFVRYFITVMWVLVVYPIIIKKVIKMHR